MSRLASITNRFASSAAGIGRSVLDLIGGRGSARSRDADLPLSTPPSGIDHLPRSQGPDHLELALNKIDHVLALIELNAEWDDAKSAEFVNEIDAKLKPILTGVRALRKAFDAAHAQGAYFQKALLEGRDKMETALAASSRALATRLEAEQSEARTRQVELIQQLEELSSNVAALTGAFTISAEHLEQVGGSLSNVTDRQAQISNALSHQSSLLTALSEWTKISDGHWVAHSDAGEAQKRALGEIEAKLNSFGTELTRLSDWADSFDQRTDSLGNALQHISTQMKLNQSDLLAVQADTSHKLTELNTLTQDVLYAKESGSGVAVLSELGVYAPAIGTSGGQVNGTTPSEGRPIVIEMIGPSGVGKSSILRTADRSRTGQRTWLSPRDIEPLIRRGKLDQEVVRAATDLANAHDLIPRCLRVMAESHMLPSQMIAAANGLRNSSVASAVIEHLPPSMKVVHDELLLHRASSIFLYSDHMEHEGHWYFSRVPAPDGLIVVSAPVEVIIERIQRRPHNSINSYFNLVDGELERIVQRSLHLDTIAVEILENRGVKIAFLDATESREANAGKLIEFVGTIAGKQND